MKEVVCILGVYGGYVFKSFEVPRVVAEHICFGGLAGADSDLTEKAKKTTLSLARERKHLRPLYFLFVLFSSSEVFGRIYIFIYKEPIQHGTKYPPIFHSR
jgi:hypothetical protein